MLIALIVVATVLVTGAVIGGLAGREPRPIDPPRRQRTTRNARRESTTRP